MIGLDTGFFIELLKGNAKAIVIWKNIVDSEIDAAVSGLSIYELKKLSLKGALAADEAQDAIDALLAACKVAWVDNSEMLYDAALLSHGSGIPTIDAIILASLIHAGAETVYTTDRHMENFKKKGIRINNLSEKY